METAVHVALGSNLVILGMSLNDRYLRAALLRHRRWLGDVYWFDQQFQHEEWARVAHVTLVRGPHADIWTQLATTILEGDPTDTFKDRLDQAVSAGNAMIQGWREQWSAFQQRTEARFDAIWDRVDERQKSLIRQSMIDRGLPVPDRFRE